jgi:hypothetical protein
MVPEFRISASQSDGRVFCHRGRPAKVIRVDSRTRSLLERTGAIGSSDMLPSRPAGGLGPHEGSFKKTPRVCPLRTPLRACLGGARLCGVSVEYRDSDEGGRRRRRPAGGPRQRPGPGRRGARPAMRNAASGHATRAERGGRPLAVSAVRSRESGHGAWQAPGQY